MQIIYTGPTTRTAEGQIGVTNSLISRKGAAMTISASAEDAVVPVLTKAMKRGVKMISCDLVVARAGRQLHPDLTSNELIGNMRLELAADAFPDR